VDQLVDRQSHNLEVVGSIPTGTNSEICFSVGSSAVEQEAVVLCVGCSNHPLQILLNSSPVAQLVRASV
jgi:hypothetical protein